MRAPLPPTVALLFLLPLVTALQSTPPHQHLSSEFDSGALLAAGAPFAAHNSDASRTTVHDGIKVIKETLYLPPTRPTSNTNGDNNNNGDASTSKLPTQPSANILTIVKSIYTVFFHGIHHPVLAMYTYLPFLAKGMYNTVLYYFFYCLYSLLSALLFYVLVPILSATASVLLWLTHPFVKIYELIMYFAPIWTTVLASVAFGAALGSIAGYFTAQSTKDLLVSIVEGGPVKTLQKIAQGELSWRELLPVLSVGGRQWKDWGTGFRLGGYSVSSLKQAQYEYTKKGRTGPGMDMTDQRGYLEPPTSYSSSANSSDSRFPMLSAPAGPSFSSNPRKAPRRENVDWNLMGSNPSIGRGGVQYQEGGGDYYEEREFESFEGEEDDDTEDTISASNGGRSGKTKERERGRGGGMRYL